MDRIFGRSKNTAPVSTQSLTETSDTMEKKGQVIQMKIDNLDKELLGYKEKMSKMRPGPALNGLKQKALRLLKQKKMYEGQRDQLMNTQFTLDQTKFASDQAKDTVSIVSGLKEANQVLKSQLSQINIDDVYDVTDDLADLMEDNNMIQEALARSYDTDFIDETELDAELEMLGDDLTIGENETPSYLSLPNVSQTTGSQSSGKTAVPMGL